MAFVPNPTGEEVDDDEEEKLEDLAEVPVTYRMRGSVIRFNL